MSDDSASGLYSSAGECGYCGDHADRRWAFELEWPPESEEDPGYAALQLCERCVTTVADTVLIGRALALGCDVYDGLGPAVADVEPPEGSTHE